MGQSKVLVAWFSASGVTADAAAGVAEATGADRFAIVPAVPYAQEDLNWRDRGSRSSVEMQDSASRPAIAGRVEDMKQYDVVFLGFPIWWYTAPRIISTFLESYDFTGKTLVLFATSGGSGMGKTREELETLAPGAKWLPGKRLTCRQEAKTWARSLSL